MRLKWLSADELKRLLFDEGLSIQEAADFLSVCYPHQKGLSRRNIQSFMQENGISLYGGVSRQQLENAVRSATSEVGPSYGRKMMVGYLKATGVNAAEVRVGQAQTAVAEVAQFSRFIGAQRQMNPSPYCAPHFGYSLHIDQNEKLVDYGVVFVLAVDGLSNFMAAAAVMPHKNNITIYEHVFASAVRQYGLWDQVISDHGTDNMTIGQGRPNHWPLVASRPILSGQRGLL